MFRSGVVVSLVVISLLIPYCAAEVNQSPAANLAQLADIPRIYGEDISETIYTDVSSNSYRNFIIKLTENGSRWSEIDVEYSSQANKRAREWIASELETVSNGRIEVDILDVHKSVIGRLPGYLPEGPVLMVGGHYDSVPGSPGANDDASGVAAALELARVMSKYEWPLDVYFCAWNSEEIGLYGSHEAALEFKAQGIDILAYYNVDMLLVEDPAAPIDERVFMAHSFDSQRFAELASTMGNNYGRNVIKPITEGMAGGLWKRSDHYSFYREGYESVMFAYESGGERDTAYHTSDDAWDNPLYNYTVAYFAIAAMGASMASVLARSHYGQISNEFQSRLRPIDVRELEFVVGEDTRFRAYLSWNGGTIEAELRSPTGSNIFTFVADSDSFGRTLVINENMDTGGLCTLILRSDAPENVYYDLEVQYDTDLNRDNVPDSEQFWLDVALYETDEDGDTLSDALEYIIGTNPFSIDSDSDGMPDNWERINGLNPLLDDGWSDMDNDGLTNALEYEYGTNPGISDSDSDSLPDAWEVYNGTDPLVDDAGLDPDNDGLSNLLEFGYGTFPLSNDSDGDLTPDLWEIQNGLDPTFDDTFRDYDFDDLNCYEEYIYGTDPLLSDSDEDQIPDGWEVENGLDPLVDDASEDFDRDGTSNLEEYLQGTNPNIADISSESSDIILSVSLIFGIAIVAVIFLKRRSIN